jgi:hypothetical protein
MDEDSVDEKLCKAYREGCQKTINAKLDAICDKVDTVVAHTTVQSTAIMALTSKVTVLELNEIPHLRRELTGISKTRREPLSWKDLVKIILVVLGSAGFWQLVNSLPSPP